MSEKWKRFIILPMSIFVCGFIFACSGDDQEQGILEYDTSTEQNMERGKAEMERTECIVMLKNCLGCGDRTADSLLQTIEAADISGITNISLHQEKNPRILEIGAADSQLYYVYIEKGYFISRICSQDLNGEKIYEAIE
ncbi:MAG: hypothetical protein PHV18_12175 [Lachnospiraceae bacterium]|nr:hypothetical protein [Lachnospiraceae bacterium]